MLVAALTGNYGMGKSSVLLLFRNCGAATINSDEIVNSLLQEREVLDKIRAIFGDGFFLADGDLNKTKVANAVFRDASMRRSLEDVLHPLVFGRMESFLRRIEDGLKVAVVEIPLLFERGYQNRFGKTITVFADEETAVGRLGKEGISRDKALLRLQSQLLISEKMDRSDFVIDNNGTIEDTNIQVKRIYEELLREAKKGGNSTGARQLT